MIRKTLASVTCVALLSLAACSSSEEPATPKPTPLPTPSPTASPTPEVEPTPAPEEKPKGRVTLSFAGDIMFQNNLASLLANANSLAPLKSALGSADLTMVNLESAITTRGAPTTKELENPNNVYHFRAPEKSLQLLKNAGVDVVTVANNHGADYGAEGLKDTLKAKKNGILPVVGVGTNELDALTPHVTTVKNTSFSFFGADASKLESNKPIWQAGQNNAGLTSARGDHLKELLRAVKTASQVTDVVVVYMHWGEESTSCPDGNQQRLAAKLSKAGADIIVGSHTHKVMGSGWLGESYVAYGLGNFIWYHGQVADTGVLTLTVDNGRVVKDHWNGGKIPYSGGLPKLGQSDAPWRALRGCSQLSSKAPKLVKPAEMKSSISPITKSLAKRMGSTWREGCPVSLDKLSYLRLPYVDFKGEAQLGEMIVATKVAPQVVKVFEKLFKEKYPIRQMRLASDWGGDDDKIMAADNTSGFNCRYVAGTTRWSNHSYGEAIDINPLENPYVVGSNVSPEAGRKYAFTSREKEAAKGYITSQGVVVRAFASIDWGWGGAWSGSKDYQHFSANGR